MKKTFYVILKIFTIFIRMNISIHFVSSAYNKTYTITCTYNMYYNQKLKVNKK